MSFGVTLSRVCVSVCPPTARRIVSAAKVMRCIQSRVEFLLCRPSLLLLDCGVKSVDAQTRFRERLTSKSARLFICP